MRRFLRPFAALAIASATLATAASGQHRATLRSNWGQSRIASEMRSGGANHLSDSATLGGQQPPRRSSGGRLALQFLAASGGAVGGGLATYLALRDISPTRVKGDDGYSRSGNVGYLVGSFAGATLGAHLVGTRMGGHSPWWATSLGALLGTVPLAALGVDEPYLPLFGIALGWIPQAGLAAVGFSAGESQ